jgi:deoxyribonuclease-4
MTPLKLGAHTSIAGGLTRAFEEGEEIKADVIQIFSKNQRQWIGKDYSQKDLAAFHQKRTASKIDAVMIHTSYLINLASDNPETLTKSIDALVDELHRAHMLQIPFVVLHPGSHLGKGEAEGITAIAQNLRLVFERAENDDVTVLLEITAGQGTNLGYRYEHLRDIIDQCDYTQQTAVCLDTCHMFAAGYDIRTPEAWDNAITDFDKVIGLDKLKGFHFNDSKHPLGSKKDRHERIGQGDIGESGFRSILQDKRVNHLPMILEVPGGLEAYKADIELLRQLAKQPTH